MGVTNSTLCPSSHDRRAADLNSAAPSIVTLRGGPNMEKNSSSRAWMTHAAVRFGSTAMVTKPVNLSTISKR